MINEENGADYGLVPTPEPPTDSEDLARYERLLDRYNNCLLAEDTSGLVRVRCVGIPEYNVINPCPRFRWLGPAGMFGSTALEIEDEEWAYCLHEDDATNNARTCANLQCTDGRVCESDLRWTNEYQKPYCISAEMCLAARESIREGLACIYADMTIAETGDLAEADCETLDEGECSINCGCSAEGEKCHYISEEHPVGVCGTSDCYVQSDYESCFLQDGRACMHLTSPPSWLAETESVTEGEREVALGFCVDTEFCATLQERYPGVYNCAYDDD